MRIFDFDIVAILVAAIALYHFYTRKRDVDAQSRAFVWFGDMVLLDSALGISRSMLINALPDIPRALVMAATTVYYLSHSAVMMLSCAYILTLVYPSAIIHTWRRWIGVPYLVSAAVIVANVFSPIVFYIDGEDRYTHGPLRFILYVNVAVYFLVAFTALFQRRKSLSGSRAFALAIALVLPIIAVVVQQRVPDLMLESFAASLSALFILLTIHDRSECVDGDTGLLNRQSFLSEVAQLHADDISHSVIVIHSGDLANLRGLLGQESFAGFLLAFALWLKKNAGTGTQSYSLDEGLFAIIIPSTAPKEAAGELSLAILERSRGVWSVDGLRVELPVRLCLLRHPDDGVSADETIETINQLVALPPDTAGRHAFRASDFELAKRRRDTMIGARLKRMLDEDGLELWYQPIVRASDRTVVAYEALTEIRMPDDEVIRQSNVLRIAAAYGILAPLGGAYLSRAFRRLSSAPRGEASLHLRLYAPLLFAPNWARDVMELSRSEGVDLSLICFELTETSVATSNGELAPGMRALAEAGAMFALDDYGSGYTDLESIWELPFSIIKFDKKMIRLGLESKQGRQMLAGSVTMFRELGKIVLAEGIESFEDASALAGMGIDWMQGYYFGHPEREV